MSLTENCSNKDKILNFKHKLRDDSFKNKLKPESFVSFHSIDHYWASRVQFNR